MKNTKYIALLLFLLQACTDKGTLFYKNATIPNETWAWEKPVQFVYEQNQTENKVNLNAVLRIKTSYGYSNIWLKYNIKGPELNEINQFSIQLADNQYGKWLGQGSGSLLTYEQVFIQNKVLKPGKYTVTIWQNMRDQKITNVVDMGLKATKGEPNF